MPFLSLQLPREVTHRFFSLEPDEIEDEVIYKNETTIVKKDEKNVTPNINIKLFVAHD